MELDMHGPTRVNVRLTIICSLIVVFILFPEVVNEPQQVGREVNGRVHRWLQKNLADLNAAPLHQCHRIQTKSISQHEFASRTAPLFPNVIAFLRLPARHHVAKWYALDKAAQEIPSGIFCDG